MLRYAFVDTPQCLSIKLIRMNLSSRHSWGKHGRMSNTYFKWVRSWSEGKSCKWALHQMLTFFFFIRIWVYTLIAGISRLLKVVMTASNINWTSLFFEGRTTKYWVEFNVDCSFTDNPVSLVISSLQGISSSSLHQFQQQLQPILSRYSWACSRYSAGISSSWYLTVKRYIDFSFILISQWFWNLQHRLAIELVSIARRRSVKCAYWVKEVSTDFIHLVSEYGAPRNSVFSCLTPTVFASEAQHLIVSRERLQHVQNAENVELR